MQNQTAGFLHKFFELNHRETDWFKYFSAKHPRDLLLYTQKNKWPDGWSCFGNKKESGIWKPGWWARSWWLIDLCEKKVNQKKTGIFKNVTKRGNFQGGVWVVPARARTMLVRPFSFTACLLTYNCCASA